MTAGDTRHCDAGGMAAAPSPVLVARGPLRLEARLLRELEPWVGVRDPAALARPLRVLVPSRSLREHLARILVRRHRALAGVLVQTLHAAAHEMLERGGATPTPGDLLFPVAVRECARAEPALRERLDGLEDGYGVVEASVADLLDAGFEPAHGEALCEAVEAESAADTLRERGLALVRVAALTAQLLTRWGAGHRSRLFRAARECLEADPERALPARAVFAYGFSDATAVQADLLDALVRHRAARIFLDRPPDPAEPAAVDPGVAFSERFARRLSGVCSGFDEESAPPDSAVVEVLHAPGLHAEVRAVADRVRERLDAGVEPEGIAVVARHLAPYRAALRLHLRRLGIPFSGGDQPGPPGPAGRRIAALLSLLRQRERVAAERWLDALERLPGGAPLSPAKRADLLLALHVLGAARLQDVAVLEPGGRDVALPARLGLAPDGARRPPHRYLSAALLEAAVAAAAQLRARIAAWPAREALARHLDRVRELLRDDLGWRDSTPGARELGAALFDAGAALPGGVVLDREGLDLFVRRCTGASADEPLGGRGAGVQLLDVMQARGRSFEHLFVLGLSRDSFPRAIAEDPLLPDRVRRGVRAVLEDLPVKSEGHDEERYLFAQLLAAAPRVTLSAPVCDEDGRARPVSPLLERLRFSPGVPAPRPVPALYAPGGGSGLRPAHEHAVLAGLYGTRDRFERSLALALAEAACEPSRPDAGAARALARARAAVLAELDPGLRAPRRLGPYYGFVGPPAEERDPRRADLYVTTLEQLARCPWQTFLGRLLRLEPLPDPHGELPSADPAQAALLLGSLVHRVLERIVRDALGDGDARLALEEVAQRAARPVAWPAPAALDALVAGCAEELVREEGIGLPGYARLLALLTREPLAEARGLGWPDAASDFGALGAEVEGELLLPGGRALHFRADRLDGNGSALRLVDYKTGRPFTLHKTPASRRQKFVQEVARGRLLQAVAYARAGSACGALAEGRYVYLKRGDDWPQRDFAARADDVELGGAFDAAVGALLAAFEHGSFVPRLLEPDSDEEHYACERCAVKEVCLRGDSGARRRLAEWVRACDGDASALSTAEQALLAVWRLAGAGS